MTEHKNYSAKNFNPDQLWEALDAFRNNVGLRVQTRMGKGDVRSAILRLLAEEPLHGYEIIRRIEQNTDGAWKPSAGSVYPTLQLLADEGLVTAQTANDRKVYALTEEGREAADATRAPWEAAEQGEATTPSGFTTLSKAGVDLAQAVAQVVRSGTGAQQAEVVELLESTRRKVYSILAQD
jgi:DNA-binding PadR family transcriptional regulator